MTRSYEMLCPVAISLDLLGERWTLLVIRNLLIGPQRYRDLLDGLPGIGAEMLASRLKKLEAEGIIARRRLPRPAASVVYELTEEGRGLEEPILAIVRWGFSRLLRAQGPLNFRPVFAFLFFKAFFEAEAARGVNETYEWRIEDEVYQVRVADDRVGIRFGPAESPAVVFTTDAETYAALGVQKLSLVEAMAQGKFKIEGDPAAVARVARIFRPPRPRATATS